MRKQALRLLCAASLQFAAGAAVTAGEADVVAVKAHQDGTGAWRFTVTVKHGDEGWNHYADRFEIIAPDGSVLGVRTLFHPHEKEQPFTRSLGSVKIADEVDSVVIRAHDSIHELGGIELHFELPR